MMYLKICIFFTLFITILGKQIPPSSLKARPMLHNSNNAVQFDKEDVQKALHEMLQKVDAAITKAQDVVNSAFNTVLEKVSELEKSANVEIDKVLAPFRKELDDLIAKAEEKGIDISGCEYIVTDFGNIPSNLTSDLENCLNKQVVQAQNYVNDILNNMKKIVEDLDTINQQIDDCSGNVFSQAKCYAKLLATIAEDAVTIPAKIAEDATKTVALITGLLENLEICAINELKDAGKDAAKDIAEFTLCAAL
ncbi:uncharacterized protein [Euwallacea fornicatus]|uniref:uncharacterized protein n=1 Tax=Euwallacea fornicatus TaxID=995702 RepID=UPI00338ECC1A